MLFIEPINYHKVHINKIESLTFHARSSFDMRGIELLRAKKSNYRNYKKLQLNWINYYSPFKIRTEKCIKLD